MGPIVLALAGAALVGLNVIIWTYALGVVASARRERRDAGLVPEVARLTEEGRRKDEIIRDQNAKLDALGAEAAKVRAQIQTCGIGR